MVCRLYYSPSYQLVPVLHTYNEVWDLVIISTSLSRAILLVLDVGSEDDENESKSVLTADCEKVKALGCGFGLDTEYG